jgi:hypothetical protein
MMILVFSFMGLENVITSGWDMLHVNGALLVDVNLKLKFHVEKVEKRAYIYKIKII